MSDISGPNESPAEVGPEYLDSASAPLRKSGSSSKKVGLIAAAAVAGVGVIGAGAWAATAFFSDGAQPSQALPSTTLAYVSIDLAPSGEQQLAAYRFLKKFPALDDAVDLGQGSDPREEIFNWIQDQDACEGLDYADDIEPWLGTSAAVAAVDTGRDAPSPVAVVAIEDADAANSGIKKIQACSDSEDSGTWVIAGDWAIFAEENGVAEEVVAATAEGSLADNAEHTKWLDEVGDLGVMTMYVGPDALDEVLAADEVFADPSMGGVLDQFRDKYKDFDAMAATLRFDGAGLELVAASDASLDGAVSDGTGAGQSVANLPDDTVAALGVSVGKEYAQTLIDELATMDGSGQDSAQIISEIEQQTGLKLPEDLQTLLGDTTVLAVGGDIDIDNIANSSDGSDIPVGLKISGDADGVESVVDKVRQALESVLGPQAETILASDSSGDIVAIGPSADYRDRLLADGDLGGSKAFTDVVGDVENASAVFFLDFDGADNWLDNAIADTGEQEMIDNVLPLSALGASARIDGDVAHFTLRVSTN